MKQLYVIDAVNYLFRAYFAIRNMSNPAGKSTNALYGFIRSVQKIIKDFKPTHFIAVFDGPDNKKSRTDIYESYKSHRTGMPEDLFEQLDDAKAFCEIAGIPHIEVPGVEADDTIGSIANWAANQGAKVFLCSSDKDLCQLISKQILVLNTAKNNLLIDAAKVEEIYGIRPGQMIDYLAIMGDSSDGIPGIPGLGAKSAASILQKCETLENLLKNPEYAGSERKQQLVIDHAKQARLSQKLATIDLKIPFPKKESFFELIQPDRNALITFYHDMHFLSLLKEMGESTQTTSEKPLEKKESERGKKEAQSTHKYHLVNDETAFCSLIDLLKKSPSIGIDTETTHLSPLRADLVGIGFAVKAKEAYYVPMNGELDPDTVLDALTPIFADPKKGFFGHNIKYDLHILQNNDIHIRHIDFDTMIASHLIRPERSRHGLDTLALEQLHKKMTPIKTLIGSGKKQKSMADIDLKTIANYCCEDIDYTLRLKQNFEKELKKKNVESLFFDIEIPLIHILAKMERHGIYVDPKAFKTMAKTLSASIKIIQKKIYEAAGESFNINSPKTLSHILFHKLNIKQTRAKKTQTHLSTSADVLKKLAPDHPICRDILHYRLLEKLRTTYVETLPQQINPDTERIHCSFNQSGTATGRLACQDPNLQNIPTRSEEGRQIRKAFKPQKKGWSFISADYSQIELRLLAAFSEEKALIEAFRKGDDIHTFTASSIFNTPLEKVTREMRARAKAVNFGIIYGQQAFGLSELLDIPIKEASSFIKTYFDRYPKVKKYIEHSQEKALEKGYAETIFGRKRPIPEIDSNNPSLRSLAQRLAVNTPLQGSQADIIKEAMIRIDEKLQSYEGFMVLQIHDELIFEAPDNELKAIQKLVTHEMENIVDLKVSLTVDIKIGKNWAAC